MLKATIVPNSAVSEIGSAADVPLDSPWTPPLIALGQACTIRLGEKCSVSWCCFAGEIFRLTGVLLDGEILKLTPILSSGYHPATKRPEIPLFPARTLRLDSERACPTAISPWNGNSDNLSTATDRKCEKQHHNCLTIKCCRAGGKFSTAGIESRKGRSRPCDHRRHSF